MYHPNKHNLENFIQHKQVMVISQALSSAGINGLQAAGYRLYVYCFRFKAVQKEVAPSLFHLYIAVNEL